IKLLSKPNRSCAAKPCPYSKPESLKIGPKKGLPMNVSVQNAKPAAMVTAPDLATLKTKQQAAWASGDYAVVGTTLQIVGEELCEALDLRSGQKVLDVAAGNGNATLAAARRW